MAEPQQDEAEEVYVEHQYMCSECQQLFNSLQDVLVHQQIHTAQEVEVDGGVAVAFQGLPEVEQEQHYQCLECGSVLVNPEELLQHQELHMRESGMETEQPDVYEVQEIEEPAAETQPVQYQCLDCLALFDSPETWLEHRRTHNSSSTHSETPVEYVLQPDGTVAPLMQNCVLSEQQAGEILAQVLAQQQKKPLASLLPPVTATPGSATMHLQILTAQAAADNSGSRAPKRARPAPLLPAMAKGSSARLMENGVQRLELRLTPQDYIKMQAGELVVCEPYECSECSLVLQTPEDFLRHQGEHILCHDKSHLKAFHQGAAERMDVRIAVSEKEPAWRKSQECPLCNRTFSSINRLTAHKRVHEQGTHECPECGKVFKKATTLQTHMRSHSGVARHLCVDCGQSFPTELTLVMHRKSHTDEPLHKCQFCNKTFTNMTKYLYHRRTHLERGISDASASTVAAPTRASLSALAIIQQARERKLTLSHVSPLEPDVEQEKGKMVDAADDSCEILISNIRTLSQKGSNAKVSVAAQGQTELAPKTDGPEEASVGVDAPPQQTEEGGVPCPSCTETLPSRQALIRHRRICHAAERSFVCGVCGKSFRKRIHVRNHIRTHTGERPFQCSDCGKTFSSLTNLMRHNLVHSGIRPYRCDVCQRCFSQSSNLRQHQLLHSDTGPLTCPNCSATFRRPAKLAAHRYTNHPGSPAPFPCPHCEAGFLTRRQRDSHCAEQHPTLSQAVPDKGKDSDPSAESKPEEGSAVCRGGFECEVCGKKLNSAANLRLHKLSHAAAPGRPRPPAGMRPKAHQCPVCGKLFVSSSGVALHQRVHTGERPFPCQVCGKRFRQNTHLREHLRIHSGERPFCCEVCGKGFIQSMHLAEHRRTHTGERPHVCPECGKAFKTFSNLRNHKKTHARQRKLDAEAAAAPESEPAVTMVDASAVELVNGQHQLIQIQTADGQQVQGTPTMLCNEFGETIAIIETSEGGVLPLEQALQIYHTALENGLAMETVAVEGLQLL
ncbi:zinc finger protein 574 isoform X1 [Synchiropus splendidus]|uniref:zinc finger protein 574 isoform X1 n=1 Tax=Synchiropus splendidus TaxID=270530 RepID=UPI00237E0410|nr:zinc finger protein 574 isoform X1 [Synchiropus splendidus]XP_053737712.1 zinc finger protein 574 isoform X1 [Synchiropus splendidus]